MKPSVSYVIFGIQLIIIILLIIQFGRMDQQLAMKDTIIAEKTDSLSYRKNREGQLIAEKAAAEASVKEIKAAYPALAEELKREFDIKLKDVKAYIKNTFEARGSGEAVVHNHYTLADSTGSRYPVWTIEALDGYLDFRATVNPQDSLHVPFAYSYRDTVTTVISSHKKWLFGKETIKASTSFKNPNAKVTAATNIIINNVRDKRFGVSVGVSYDPFHSTVIPTIHVGYNLLRF